MKNLREVLTKDISYLYLLAYLLTGEQETAMQCVVNGLEDCIADNLAFKHWAHTWSKRTIIKNGIAMMVPTPAQSGNAPIIHRAAGVTSTVEELIAAVLQLPLFDRFVFVITLLEGYSDRGCSVLLDCTPAEVERARTRISQSIPMTGETSSAKGGSWQGSLLSQAVACLMAIGSLL